MDDEAARSVHEGLLKAGAVPRFVGARLGEVDTLRRYIYIHGCPDDDPMGNPSSRGCVKMRNNDIIRLFDRVPVGTRVTIRG